MSTINRRVVLKERPKFQVPSEKCFRVEESATRDIRNGEFLIRTYWLGMDPYLFSKVKKVSSQAKPIDIGEVMYGAAVGRVEASKKEGFNEGDYVFGLWGWQEYFVSNGDGVSKIDPVIPRPSYMLGALGAAGFGAYLAIRNVLEIKPGDTVFCSAATGALGQIVGQIARLKGAEVFGTASSDEKCELAIKKLGYTDCIKHTEDNLSVEIKKCVPGGIDAMVVSTGGRSFDSAFPLMNVNGRIAVCGLMALYSMVDMPIGPDKSFSILNDILLKRLRVQGSMVLDFLGTDVHREFFVEMSNWIRLGAVKPVEDITIGLENAPSALRSLFEGTNVGKALVQVAE